MLCTTKEIAEIFGVSDRTIRLWETEKGCPKEAYGRWDPRAVLLWWLENVYDAGNDSEAIAAAKLLFWESRARTEKVKADLAENQVAPKEDYIKAWVWRVAEMSAGLGGLPTRLAPLVAMKPELEVRKTLDKEIWQIRDKFSRTGKFTPEVTEKSQKSKP
jgi:phage terminase Nu1 subunit (DNA packaging protein)